jgi:hypothetical protein
MKYFNFLGKNNSNSFKIIIFLPFLRYQGEATWNVDKISRTKWRSYFSYFQGTKAANSKLFKDLVTQKK